LTKCFEADGHGGSSATEFVIAIGTRRSVGVEVARLGVMLVVRRSLGIGIELNALM
jgi:hypothetical protein